MNLTPDVPRARIRAVNEATARDDGEFVLYWMIANRRLRWNFALQRAIEQARTRSLPLLVFEPLRAAHRWASDRFHRFVMDGMLDNGRRLDATPIGYYPWVEPAADAGKGLLAALATGAAVIVTDDAPMFFLPAMLRAAGEQLDVRIEAVDSVGLLPLASSDAAFKTAHAFRRFLQAELPEHLDRLPAEDPTVDLELPSFDLDPADLAAGYEPTATAALEDDRILAALPIDHDVAPTDLTGGATAAGERLRAFVGTRLSDYGDGRDHPDEEHGSRLSPYLHFGHISSHEIFATVAAEETWTAAHLADTTDGARSGWWGMSEPAEAWLDQLVTWRELGFNMCHHRDDYDRYESLPDWARATLDEHRDDERPHLYELDELDAAATHDEIWNAAQTQLVVEGRVHGYLRMLWGKKILEWTPTPELALAHMIELNNRYALDGRDANSYAGIFWVLGRYDRAWGPERPVYGKVRYMTSKNTAKKLCLRKYLDRYAPTERPAMPAAGR